MLSELPRFYAAKRYSLALMIGGMGFAVLGLLFYRAGTAPDGLLWYTAIPVPRALAYLGPAFWIAAAGFLSAALIAIARNNLLAATRKDRPAPTRAFTRPVADTAIRKLQARILFYVDKSRHWRLSPVLFAAWPQTLATAVLGALAIAATVMLWRLPASAPDAAAAAHIFGAALIALAFPLLVLERLYANIAVENLPEAPQIDRLLRVPLTASIGLAVTMLLLSAGFAWARYIQDAVVLLLFAVSAELLLRSATMIFVPYLPMETRRAVADSAIARFLLRLNIPNIRTININVRNQFGIDLSRSWALAFVRQAALPVLAGLGIFSWCVTGITELGVSQRGLYERFGVPVAVLGPGLHFHLPWPFGSVRLAENGVIHHLAIEFLLPNGDNSQGLRTASQGTAKIPGAEDAPPPSEDRLWDADHPSEGVYLNAHMVDGRQTFQLADTDMTVIYRVGLSDQAVRDVAYHTANPDDLIQAMSGQLITGYFAQHPLLDVIGNSRAAFTDNFRTDLQAKLDKVSSGIEIMAVSIEAVHPPAAAAAAFQYVQAAGIYADTTVSTAKGMATRVLSAAQMQASSTHNASTATATELVAQAKTDATLFDAERKAYATAGPSFLLERWLDNLTQALAKTSSVVLVDHRLQGADVPTLDLRAPGAAGSGPAALPSGAPGQGGAGQPVAPPANGLTSQGYGGEDDENP